MLQQNFYNEGNRYLKWINKNIYKTLITIDLVTLLLPFLILINKNIAYITAFIVYTILFIIKYTKKRKTQVKIDLVYTFRIKRLLFTTIIIYIIFLLCYFQFINNDYILLPSFYKEHFHSKNAGTTSSQKLKNATPSHESEVLVAQSYSTQQSHVL